MVADTESHSHILGGAQRVLSVEKGEDGLWSQKGQGQHKNKAHRIIDWRSRALTDTSSLCVSDRSPLHIFYACLACCSCGIPNSDSEALCLNLFPACGTVFLLLGCLIQH